ncbi:MAG: hypothetical protein WBI28_03365 [Candidatus Omnitrophota bacterium]
MRQDNQIRSIFFFSQTGCLLPFFIILNLLFGWIFLSPLLWFGIELLLILVFAINLLLLAKKVTNLKPKYDKVIDTQAEVINSSCSRLPESKK